MFQKQHSNAYDLVVIGGGPAGLTAAIYAQRALLSTVIVEKATPGGQLNETSFVENYPGFEEKILGPELVHRMRVQAERLGATIISDEVTALHQRESGYAVELIEGNVTCRAAIVCSGSRPRELTVDGAARLKGRGISYCATCDGFFFQDNDVLEVGAGEAGLTEALFLTRFASSVGIVIRHPQEDPLAFRATPTLQQRVKEDPKIYYIWNSVIDSVLGEDRVTEIVLRNLGTGEPEKRAVEGVFVNIGHIPETGFLQDVVELDDNGYVMTDVDHGTSLPGVLAAGDVRAEIARYSQAVIAAGDGAAAALEADRYLSGRG